MTRNRSRVTRATVVSLALVGALGLSACQDTEVTAPSPAAPTASSTSEAPTPSSSSTTTSESPTTSDSSTSSATSSASSASAPAAGSTKLTAPDSTLKFGQPGTIDEGSDNSPEIMTITPKKLEVAPAAAYTEANLNKANGTLYYLTFDVTNVQGGSNSTSVNGLFFHPKISAANKGAKRLYGDTEACKSGDNPELGKTATQCYLYQIPGSAVSDVEYDGFDDQHITWTK
ncbi:hypothetical protein [Luteipulveratus flavus]|uniref:DUF4352 domain-containing protein n=1 Tax=Luteipulveratus flavus TaxID=3031728 RepID=A0ABT6C7L5_9MICO|nr:hypothetical protein [Luteipulveratus sp. YIM 133296]MDF8264775.1 hypothetical protein [Luteipulveratus sp. YIM 133296]